MASTRLNNEEGREKGGGEGREGEQSAKGDHRAHLLYAIPCANGLNQIENLPFSHVQIRVLSAIIFGTLPYLQGQHGMNALFGGADQGTVSDYIGHHGSPPNCLEPLQNPPRLLALRTIA